MSEPTMGTEALGDNLKKLLPDLADKIGDKLKDLLTPSPLQPGAPVPAPAPGDSQKLPAWLTTLLGILLGLVLNFIGDKYGVKPQAQSAQPSVVVLQVPAGSTVAGAK